MDPPSMTRRRLLAGAGTAMGAALAGCSERIWTQAEHTAPEQVALSITTLPADDDPMATKIASQLAENLRDAGIDAVREPMARPELYRSVLTDHDFDLFVARHSGLDDLDAMRSMLHSEYASERGWQNPFGFSDVTVDEILERQLIEHGSVRRESFNDLFEYLLETAPYSVVAFPYHLGAADVEVPVSFPPRTPLDYVDIFRDRPDEWEEDGPFRVGLFGKEMTDRLNPITVDVGNISAILNLLYDPLVRYTDREFVPWLAEDVTWERDDFDDDLEATVELREGLTWHDGTEIVADDVEFTVRFLKDTSLGEVESAIPAPRYRGRQTLIDGVSTDGRSTVRLTFGEISEEVARRSLTIPLLPEHVWESRSELIGEHRTEALAIDNEEPIGSGLFRFADSETDERIVLEPFDDHVLLESSVEGYSSPFDGFPQYSELEFVISGLPGATVENLLEGEVNLVAGELPPGQVEPIENDGGVRLLSRPTRSFYLVGYNVRHPVLGNPRFREIVSRLVDRQYVVSEFFDGHAIGPASNASVAGVAQDVDDWDHGDRPAVTVFPGSDGEIDTRTVRGMFEDAGFRYEDGDLLA